MSFKKSETENFNQQSQIHFKMKEKNDCSTQTINNIQVAGLVLETSSHLKDPNASVEGEVLNNEHEFNLYIALYNFD